MTRGSLRVPAGLSVVSTPEIALRGHQLGYRPKTNAYDAWDVPMWEQYIRDLAIFGSNAIELIPPRSDDAADSPHFPLPQIDMMVEMSRIADEYAQDVWIWYPALDKDYGDPEQVEFALKEWAAVFAKLPRIDAIFVPGGDPGHTQPKHLMAMLERQTASLRKYHPNAQMWVSPQGFTKPWMDEFYQILKAEPAWLTGLVFGPQVRDSLPVLRENTAETVPHPPLPRHHAQSAEPVPGAGLGHRARADVAARADQPAPAGSGGDLPRAAAARDRTSSPTPKAPTTTSTSSCGAGLAGTRRRAVMQILREYSRYFIGDRYADSFAPGAARARAELARSACREHVGLHDARAVPGDGARGVARATCATGASSRRCIAPTTTPTCAAGCCTRRRSRNARSSGCAGRERGESRRRSPRPRSSSTRRRRSPHAEWRLRVYTLAEALFQSIRQQLSVARYGAIAVGRGATLDSFETPLNNSGWLRGALRRGGRARDGGRSARCDRTASCRGRMPARAATTTTSATPHGSRTWCAAFRIERIRSVSSRR